MTLVKNFSNDCLIWKFYDIYTPIFKNCFLIIVLHLNPLWFELVFFWLFLAKLIQTLNYSFLIFSLKAMNCISFLVLFHQFETLWQFLTILGYLNIFFSYFQFEAEELDFTSCSVPHCLVTRNTLSRWRQAAIKMFKFPLGLPMTLHLCPEADREKW